MLLSVDLTGKEIHYLTADSRVTCINVGISHFLSILFKIFALIFSLHPATRKICLFSAPDKGEIILNVSFFSGSPSILYNTYNGPHIKTHTVSEF